MLINKQINKSSASLSRGGQVERPHRKGTPSPVAPVLVLNAPRLAIVRTYRNPQNAPGVWAPRLPGTPAALGPTHPARPGSTPPPSPQLSRWSRRAPSAAKGWLSKVSPTGPTGKQLQEVTAEPGGGGGGDWRRRPGVASAHVPGGAGPVAAATTAAAETPAPGWWGARPAGAGTVSAGTLSRSGEPRHESEGGCTTASPKTCSSYNLECWSRAETWAEFLQLSSPVIEIQTFFIPAPPSVRWLLAKAAEWSGQNIQDLLTCCDRTFKLHLSPGRRKTSPAAYSLISNHTRKHGGRGRVRDRQTDLPSPQHQSGQGIEKTFSWARARAHTHTHTSLACKTGKARKRLAKAKMSHPLIVNLNTFRVDIERWAEKIPALKFC